MLLAGFDLRTYLPLGGRVWPYDLPLLPFCRHKFFAQILWSTSFWGLTLWHTSFFNVVLLFGSLFPFPVFSWYYYCCLLLLLLFLVLSSFFICSSSSSSSSFFAFFFLLIFLLLLLWSKRRKIKKESRRRKKTRKKAKEGDKRKYFLKRKRKKGRERETKRQRRILRMLFHLFLWNLLPKSCQNTRKNKVWGASPFYLFCFGWGLSSKSTTPTITNKQKKAKQHEQLRKGLMWGPNNK